MVYRSGFENRQGRKSFGGSNPSASAIVYVHPNRQGFGVWRGPPRGYARIAGSGRGWRGTTRTLDLAGPAIHRPLTRTTCPGQPQPELQGQETIRSLAHFYPGEQTVEHDLLFLGRCLSQRIDALSDLCQQVVRRADAIGQAAQLQFHGRQGGDGGFQALLPGCELFGDSALYQFAADRQADQAVDGGGRLVALGNQRALALLEWLDLLGPVRRLAGVGLDHLAAVIEDVAQCVDRRLLPSCGPSRHHARRRRSYRQGHTALHGGL